MGELFIGSRQIINNTYLPYQDKNNEISFSWQADPRKYYFIIMYDPDAPYPERPDMSPYIHYLVANIPGMNLLQGDEILSYISPEPPKDSRAHRYIFEIYQQPTAYDIDISNRERVDVKELIDQINLVPIYSVTFTVNPAGSPRSILRKPSGIRSTSPRRVSFSGVNGNNMGNPGYNNSGNNPGYNNSGNNPGYNNSGNNPGYNNLGYDNPGYNSGYTNPGHNNPGYNNPGNDSDKGIYFKPGSPLSEEDMKYCRCYLKQFFKQKEACKLEQPWEKREGYTPPKEPPYIASTGEECANPYAVCHASVTGEAGKIDCGLYIDFEATEDKYLQAYAQLSNIPVPVPYNRDQMLSNIYQWKM